MTEPLSYPITSKQLEAPREAPPPNHANPSIPIFTLNNNKIMAVISNHFCLSCNLVLLVSNYSSPLLLPPDAASIFDSRSALEEYASGLMTVTIDLQYWNLVEALQEMDGCAAATMLGFIISGHRLVLRWRERKKREWDVVLLPHLFIEETWACTYMAGFSRIIDRKAQLEQCKER